MKQPVIIVDPRSSGIELAPAFKARGIPVIAVKLKPLKSRQGFGTEIQASDFVSVVPDQPGLVEILRGFKPRAVIAGAEAGVPLAERLCAQLTPQFANDPTKISNRLNKVEMQMALARAGVPLLKTLQAFSENEVESWLMDNDLQASPIIIKPPMSAGSDDVFHIPAGGDWRGIFKKILSRASNVSGMKNETAVIQELALGTEFAVGTVSANGKHRLAHLIQYTKCAWNGRKTVYDHVEFVSFRKDLHGELMEYTTAVLDALGVNWGASHNEIMLTPNGPRLIESTPRMCGGPVVGFAREATGSSQADKLVEAYLDGEVATQNYEWKKSVVPVFLRSPAHGEVINAEVFAGLSQLSTLFQQHLWFKNGDQITETVDYLTSIGIVALAGDRASIFSDYRLVRAMESQLVVQPKSGLP